MSIYSDVNYWQDLAVSRGAELAAEQAKNAGLREALEYSIKQVPELATVPGISKALATQSDTSALEAIVKKAGEVMREKISRVHPDISPIDWGMLDE